jgi:hypothetical protein
MTVYPDGDALSERELRILHQIERHIEMDYGHPGEHGEVAPLHMYALYALVAEVALVLVAYMSMVALGTFASAIWTVPVRPPAGRL